MECLRCEVLALVKERDAKRIKINWQFSIEEARCKLNRHYSQVHSDSDNAWKFILQYSKDMGRSPSIRVICGPHPPKLRTN